MFLFQKQIYKQVHMPYKNSAVIFRNYFESQLTQKFQILIDMKVETFTD